MNLIRADTIPPGSEIWTEDETDDGEEVWMLAQVVRQENTLLTVRKKQTGEELEIDLVSNCFCLYYSSIPLLERGLGG